MHSQRAGFLDVAFRNPARMGYSTKTVSRAQAEPGVGVGVWMPGWPRQSQVRLSGCGAQEVETTSLTSSLAPFLTDKGCTRTRHYLPTGYLEGLLLTLQRLNTNSSRTVSLALPRGWRFALLALRARTCEHVWATPPRCVRTGFTLMPSEPNIEDTLISYGTPFHR
jgi:hypothetical protein